MNDTINALLVAEVERLQKRIAEFEAARRAYASEFRPNADGDPDVGNVHANIRSLKSALRSIRTLAQDHVTAHQIASRALSILCEE